MSSVPIILKEHEGVMVVRDDYVPGGTKQRVLERWLPEMGPGEYVYASPAEGYAQIALALACRALGPKYQAHVFVARRKVMHERTRRALDAGALITEVDNVAAFSVVAARAREYAQRKLLGVKSLPKRLLPFGLDAPRFHEIMAELASAIEYDPDEVWVTVGSGTLIRALQRVWPSAEFHAVQVGHNADVGTATKHYAPERFSQRAQVMPPFPSCDTYDAKAWRFLSARAHFNKQIASSMRRKILFWNVAADPQQEKPSSKSLDTTPRRAVTSTQQQRSSSKKEENQMGIAVAKYKSHEVTVDFDASGKLTVKTWTLPNGKAGAKGFVGKSFESAGAAGREGIKLIAKHEAMPEPSSDRRLVFYEQLKGGVLAKQPINARNVGSTPAPRTSKRDKAPVEDKSEKAPTLRNAKKPGPVTTRRATKADTAELDANAKATAKANKNRRSASKPAAGDKPAAKPRSRKAAVEELDI